MNRFFSIFNAIGVATLAVLCLLQWRQAGRLRADLIAATDNAAAEAAAVAREKSAHAQAESDLSDLRDRLAVSGAEAEASRIRAAASEHKIVTVTAESAAFKDRLGKWEVVAQQQQSVVKQLKAQQIDTAAKFNDLAIKYNALIKSAGG